MRKFLCTLLTTLLVMLASGQAGSLDPTYGIDGIKSIGSPPDLSYYSLKKSYPADNGGHYNIYSLLGPFYLGNTLIVKYLAGGNLDVTYGQNGTAEAPIMYSSSVRQKDGKITIAGSTTGAWDGIHIDGLVVRFNTDGTVDKSERFGGIGAAYEYVDVNLLGDNILISGRSESIYFGVTYFSEIWFSDNRTWTINTPSFSLTGTSYPDGDAFSYNEAIDMNKGNFVIALEGEKIIVQGAFGYIDSQTYEDNYTFHNFAIDYSVVRYNADGTRDLTFGDNGKMSYGSYSFSVSPPDDNYTPKTTISKPVALTPLDVDKTGNTNFLVTVYNLDGSVDQSFGKEGSVELDFGGTDVPKAYVWQDGKLIVGGNSTNAETGVTSFALARLNPDGSLDQSFDGDGKQLTFKDGYHFDMQRLTIQVNGLQQRLLAVGDELIAGYVLEDNVTLDCTQSKVVPTDKGACNAVVNGIDPVVTPANSNALINYSMSGATEGSGTGSVSGMTFGKGITTVTYTLAANPAQTCSFTVTVEDQEAPVVSDVSSSVTSIWPPNHKMVDVWIGYRAIDNCGATTSLSVSSNEPDQSNDPEDKPGDMVVVDNHHVQLRAERLGSGNGRIYTVTITATDAAGNTTQQSLPVAVPKSMGKNNSPAVVSKGGTPVGETERPLQVTASPNPATDQFTLQLQGSGSQLISVRVMDEQGRVLDRRSNLGTGTLQFGSTYRPGVYYVEVQQGTERKQLKLVKLAH